MKKKKQIDARDLIYEAFRYLIDDYRFMLEQEEVGHWACRLVYKNSTTGVVVTYDVREQYIDAHLYRLSGGEIIPNTTRALFSGEPMTGFSLGYIVKTQASGEMLFPLHMYDADSVFRSDAGLYKYVTACARQLRQYGHHILQGDFSSFEALDRSFREDYSKNK